MSDWINEASATDVAIVGMSGRFPGARNLAEFWRNLRAGVESVAFFSDEELLAAGLDPAVLQHPDYVKAGAVLEDIELFDAAFFGFTPREAEILDPQQRIFLETVWEALENASYDPATYQGLIGVYASSSMSSYLSNLYSHPELVSALGDFQLTLGNDKDNLATNVSYKLNLKGPSIAVQTACSSSLVAVCLACQSLLAYQCDLAVAGGVRVVVPQRMGYFYQPGGIMSPDGHCRAFDARALGTVGGNGAGAVVLKRLEEALAADDHIYAVIKGTAVNNDGALKVGYTAPGVEGQAQVTLMAQAVAGVEADTISYIEAHGTGTDMGDPIEVAALTQAFRASTEKTGFCALGSVKTNIGHLDTAAGVAGLIKTVLALQHRQLPPSLNFESPNPQIDFARSPFYVNRYLTEWRREHWPRRAGVSSFGIGGTNAHVVIEEAPEMPASESQRPVHLLVLSARTVSALESVTANLAQHLNEHPELQLADVAYTLQVGRRKFPHRRVIVCRDLPEALAALEGKSAKRSLTERHTTAGRQVVFMFPGQGAQSVNMAAGLYRTEAVFRREVDRCVELLRPHLGLDLREVMYASAEEAATAALRLQQTVLTQPALFVTEYALARLWMEWGLNPAAMIGHSIGEYVAATLAGVFSLEDALFLVAARGRLMQQMPAGSMLSVPLGEHELKPLLEAELDLASVNGPALCVVSGPTQAVAELEERLLARGLPGRRLHTSHAFHSQMMDPMLGQFAEAFQQVRLAAPQIPYVSNLTGDWITEQQATDPQYWTEHLRQTVRFAEGLERLFANPEQVLLEVGPGQTLTSLALQHPGKSTGQIVLASLDQRDHGLLDEEAVLMILGRLWLAGALANLPQLYQGENRRRLPLPTYPFERQRFWIDYQISEADTAPSPISSGKKPDIADWFYAPSWRQTTAPAFFQPSDWTAQKRRWLIFSDACGLGAKLAERLLQAQHDVTLVFAEEEFRQRGADSYAINPRRSEDYQRLLQELRSQQKFPDIMLHLWSVTHDEAESRAAFNQAQELGFYSLLFLAQALGEQTSPAPLRLGVVSNNMQVVTGEETARPEKATLLGPCQVIPREYPNVVCQSIDVRLPESGEPALQLVEQLLVEMTEDLPGAVVAYRGTHRWERDFAAVRLEETTSPPPRLRERGVYLITGGLGGIGLVLAEYLAQAVRARLVLVSRSPLPPREEWEARLSAQSLPDTSATIMRKLLALESLGAEVLLAAADVSDLAAMQRVIREARQRFGEINGVIHAAGIAGGKLIQLQNPDIAGSVLAPKAKGLLVLDEILKDANLDFLLLCSSLSALEAPLGQVDYCSANAFLDAFAHRARAAGGPPVISVNWDAWQEVGMAVNTAVPREMAEWRAESLRYGITPAEGVEVFRRILTSPMPQLAVSTTELRTAETEEELYRQDNFTEEADEPELMQAAHPRPELSTDYVAARSAAEREVALIWQQLFGLEQIGIYDNFFELGGHSLLAVQLASRLRATFQVDISLLHIFNAPTVAELAARVEQGKQATRAEQEKIEQALHLVEQLSESELLELLAEPASS